MLREIKPPKEIHVEVPSKYVWKSTFDNRYEIELYIFRNVVQIGDKYRVTLTFSLPTENKLLHPILVNRRKSLFGENLFPEWGELVNGLRSRVLKPVEFGSDFSIEVLDKYCERIMSSAVVSLFS